MTRPAGCVRHLITVSCDLRINHDYPVTNMYMA
jgi:hypothetical protein